MENHSFNILLIGGGLGGLATAIAHGQKGHKITILESTSKLQTIGGGISVPSNSMRVMNYFGLAERLQDAAEADRDETTFFRREKDLS
jgi:salicylate hydroxylase